MLQNPPAGPKSLITASLLLALWGASCDRSEPAGRDGETEEPPTAGTTSAATDVHSYARPEEVLVEHLGLALAVDFEARTIRGRASLTIENLAGTDRLHLDTRDLEIERVSLDESAEPAPFALGDEVPYLGRELVIEIEPGTRVVHVDYSSRPEAAALLWLEPEQTAGGEHPFLFTQGQAILSRTWVPCQDSPAVRVTYSAEIRVPPGLMAVMSAENPTQRSADGVYRFEMRQRVPAYLLALAVGDLEFRALGERTGVYAEPELIDRSAWEFAETEEMMAAVERLYGPYLWGRYDILVLPPFFPFGGMENPRLTFVTPTILAGDRSLVALIAHELAHSWSGNLVTNATWDDFWLNEGFTVYLERRIMEELNGRPYAEMLALLGRQDLEKQLGDLDSRDTHLHLDLAGRDPDAGMTDVAYEKGYFFLRMLEELVGRERFDAFLRDYFERNAFRSLTTAQFVDQLKRDLLAADPELLAKARIDEWIHGPGLPDNAPVVTSPAFDQVDEQLAAWAGGTAAAELTVDGWTTHEWLHFLRGLPPEMTADQMAELDRAFGLTGSGNSEILHAWLHHVIANRYQAGYPSLERFLTEMGRRKFLKPLYERLAETEDGLAMARRIYAEARPSYHPVATGTLDPILGWDG